MVMRNQNTVAEVMLFGGATAKIESFAVRDASGSVNPSALPTEDQRRPGIFVIQGPLRITATTARELAYLRVGNFARPIMRRTRVWRTGPHELLLAQPTRGKFWSVQIAADKAAQAHLDAVMATICDYQFAEGVAPHGEADLRDWAEEDLPALGPSPLVLDAIELIKQRSLPVSQVSQQISADASDVNTSLTRGAATASPGRASIPDVFSTGDDEAIGPVLSTRVASPSWNQAAGGGYVREGSPSVRAVPAGHSYEGQATQLAEPLMSVPVPTVAAPVKSATVAVGISSASASVFADTVGAVGSSVASQRSSASGHGSLPVPSCDIPLTPASDTVALGSVGSVEEPGTSVIISSKEPPKTTDELKDKAKMLHVDARALEGSPQRQRAHSSGHWSRSDAPTRTQVQSEVHKSLPEMHFSDDEISRPLGDLGSLNTEVPTLPLPPQRSASRSKVQPEEELPFRSEEDPFSPSPARTPPSRRRGAAFAATPQKGLESPDMNNFEEYGDLAVHRSDSKESNVSDASTLDRVLDLFEADAANTDAIIAPDRGGSPPLDELLDDLMANFTAEESPGFISPKYFDTSDAAADFRSVYSDTSTITVSTDPYRGQGSVDDAGVLGERLTARGSPSLWAHSSEDLGVDVRTAISETTAIAIDNMLSDWGHYRRSTLEFRFQNVRFTHPLIPQSKQTLLYPGRLAGTQLVAPRRDLGTVGGGSLYHDITTVSGYISWQMMNRVMTRFKRSS